jgi:hypothetical protein
MRLTELRGTDAGVLERRRDLSGAYIHAVVRNGLLEMPPMRPTEVSDAELDALIRFLGASP